MKASAQILSAVVEGKGIPVDIMEKVEAVAVFPNVSRAAFIAGEYGRGVLSIRKDGEWTNPLFVVMKDGSIGWKAGVESSDIVILFTDGSAVDELLDGDSVLGDDIRVAVGRTGRNPTRADLDVGGYLYGLSSGDFDGISVDGVHVLIDSNANHDYYGTGATHDRIVEARGVLQRGETSMFVAVLNRRY